MIRVIQETDSVTFMACSIGLILGALMNQIEMLSGASESNNEAILAKASAIDLLSLGI